MTELTLAEAPVLCQVQVGLSFGDCRVIAAPPRGAVLPLPRVFEIASEEELPRII